MGNKQGENKNGVLTILTNVLFVVALLFLALVVTANIIYIESPIDGSSMAPTFNTDNDEKAFINRFKKGNKGDIVVINTHEKDEEGNEVFIIKRIIATCGDRVKLNYNAEGEVEVWLNGEKLVEEYVVYSDKKNQLTGEAFTMQYFSDYISSNSDVDYNEDGLLIKEGDVFVMGDNRSVSIDSTKYGPFATSDIVGKLDFVTKKEENGKIAAIKFILFSIFGAKDKTGYIVSFA